MERAVKFALYLIEEIAVIINVTAIGARISADVFNFVSGKSHGVSHFLPFRFVEARTSPPARVSRP